MIQDNNDSIEQMNTQVQPIIQNILKKPDEAVRNICGFFILLGFVLLLGGPKKDGRTKTGYKNNKNPRPFKIRFLGFIIIFVSFILIFIFNKKYN